MFLPLLGLSSLSFGQESRELVTGNDAKTKNQQITRNLHQPFTTEKHKGTAQKIGLFKKEKKQETRPYKTPTL